MTTRAYPTITKAFVDVLKERNSSRWLKPPAADTPVAQIWKNYGWLECIQHIEREFEKQQQPTKLPNVRP